MKSIGIIGYGDFGQLTANVLKEKLAVKVYSRNPEKVPKELRASFEEVGACDYVVPTIPLGAYDSVFRELSQHIGDGSVVVDICSVKLKPAEKIKKYLPHNRLVATHPLFGPQTIEKGLQNLTFVVCDDVSDPEQARVVSDFADSFGLNVVRMTAEQHDREMAQVHALTFFVARTLLNMNVSDVELKTPSFKKLLSLIELERSHSQELFDTIQDGNPFAGDIRRAFLEEAARLAKHLDKEDTV